MKIPILLLMCLMTIGHIQAKEVIPVLDSTSKLISTLPDTDRITFTKVYNDTKEGIKGLAAALKIGSEHVYTVLVKQQLVKAVSNLVTSIMVLIIGLILSNSTLKWYRKLPNDVKEETPALLVPAMAIVISIIIFLVELNTNTIITGFINPEYGALQDIMRFLKK